MAFFEDLRDFLAILGAKNYLLREIRIHKKNEINASNQQRYYEQNYLSQISRIFAFLEFQNQYISKNLSSKTLCQCSYRDKNVLMFTRKYNSILYQGHIMIVFWMFGVIFSSWNFVWNKKYWKTNISELNSSKALLKNVISWLFCSFCCLWEWNFKHIERELTK